MTTGRFAENVFSFTRPHAEKRFSRADVWRRRDAPSQCAVTYEQMRPIYNSPLAEGSVQLVRGWQNAKYLSSMEYRDTRVD